MFTGSCLIRIEKYIVTRPEMDRRGRESLHDTIATKDY
jgi:hypothetical protein